MKWSTAVPVLLAIGPMGQAFAGPSASVLQGKWQTPCTAADSSSEQKTLTFAGDEETISEITFADKNCQTPTVSMDGKAKFALVGYSSVVSGAQEINYTIQALSLTPNTADVAADYDKQKVCNATDWVVGQPKSVLGCLFGPGVHSYDLVKIDGNRLYLGDDSGDGSSPSQRPHGLNMDEAYVRVQ